MGRDGKNWEGLGKRDCVSVGKIISSAVCHFLSFPVIFILASAFLAAKKKKNDWCSLFVWCACTAPTCSRRHTILLLLSPRLRSARFSIASSVVGTTCPFPIPIGSMSNINKITYTVSSTHKADRRHWYFDVNALFFSSHRLFLICLIDRSIVLPKVASETITPSMLVLSLFFIAFFLRYFNQCVRERRGEWWWHSTTVHANLANR